MKNKTKYVLQRILGFQNYLKIFSRFKIATLKRDKMERDFFAFMDMLHAPKNILDLGGNIGVMTVHLAERFPEARIHAIEPLEPNMNVLLHTIQKRNITNVLTYQIALGNEEGLIEMVLPTDGETRLHGLSHVIHESINEWNEGEKFKVPCTTIDKLFGSIEVQGIKIDVENFEYFVLCGGQELLKKSQPIVYAELWDNENRRNCFKLMRQLNYEICYVNNKTVLPWDENANTQNFIFRPAKIKS
jgi:FkbM family methyltransferase